MVVGASQPKLTQKTGNTTLVVSVDMQVIVGSGLECACAGARGSPVVAGAERCAGDGIAGGDVGHKAVVNIDFAVQHGR